MQPSPGAINVGLDDLVSAFADNESSGPYMTPLDQQALGQPSIQVAWGAPPAAPQPSETAAQRALRLSREWQAAQHHADRLKSALASALAAAEEELVTLQKNLVALGDLVRAARIETP